MSTPSKPYPAITIDIDGHVARIEALIVERTMIAPN
jgi:hypothetical protein